MGRHSSDRKNIARKHRYTSFEYCEMEPLKKKHLVTRRKENRQIGVNLSNFACLLVDFGKVLCSAANELQQNSNASCREDHIPQILTVLLEILRVYIRPLWPFVFRLSFNNS